MKEQHPRSTASGKIGTEPDIGCLNMRISEGLHAIRSPAQSSPSLFMTSIELVGHVVALLLMIGVILGLGYLFMVHADPSVRNGVAGFLALSALSWAKLQGNFLDLRWKEASAAPFAWGIKLSAQAALLGLVPLLVALCVSEELTASPLFSTGVAILLLAALGIGISIALAGLGCCWNDICAREVPTLEYLDQAPTSNPMEVVERYAVVPCRRADGPIRYHWTIMTTLLMTLLLSSLFLAPPLTITALWIITN